MSKINSKIKDDFQVVLLLSCFVEHPVPGWRRRAKLGINYTNCKGIEKQNRGNRELEEGGG